MRDDLTISWVSGVNDSQYVNQKDFQNRDDAYTQDFIPNGPYLVDTSVLMRPSEEQIVYRANIEIKIVPTLSEEYLEHGLSIPSSVETLPLPQYAEGGVTICTTTNTNGVDWIWKSSDTEEFFRQGELYHSTHHEPDINGTKYIEEVTPLFPNSDIYNEIASLSSSTTFNDDYIGAVVKMANGELLAASSHVANPKRRADFDVFLASSIYKIPLLTEDKHLGRNLDKNGREAYSLRFRRRWKDITDDVLKTMTLKKKDK